MPISPLSSRTAVRVAVISPAQKAAPLPEMRRSTTMDVVSIGTLSPNRGSVVR